MRKLSLAAIFCVSLAATSSALAQQLDVVFSVEGWPKIGVRADGKLDATSFTFLAAVPEASPAGKGTIESFKLELPVGDAATLFMRNALEKRVLKTVLVEGVPKGVPKPPARAPFAVRLSNVRVSSVEWSASYGNAYVFLQASKIELFTANQTSTGTMQPSQQFGWDIKAGKPM